MSARSEVVIVPYRDGPYLVRGPVLLRDQDGNAIELSRTPVALCRCGKSQMRPFCDGTHQVVRFQAPSELEGPARGARDPALKRHRAHRTDDAEASATTGCADSALHGAVQAALDALQPVSRTGNERVREAMTALQCAARDLRGGR